MPDDDVGRIDVFYGEYRKRTSETETDRQSLNTAYADIQNNSYRLDTAGCRSIGEPKFIGAVEHLCLDLVHVCHVILCNCLPVLAITDTIVRSRKKASHK